MRKHTNMRHEAHTSTWMHQHKSTVVPNICTRLHCIRLQYALGALYDHRSNMDVTGQQQQLSLRAAQFAEASANTISGLNRTIKAGSENDEADGLMFDTLLLGGRSLCNFALDGDNAELKARQVRGCTHVCKRMCMRMHASVCMHTF